jgi:hypothetical protein
MRQAKPPQSTHHRKIALTCLAVLFVPSFFVVAQRFDEWRRGRKNSPLAPTPAE